jgi:hypothetical protein
VKGIFNLPDLVLIINMILKVPHRQQIKHIQLHVYFQVMLEILMVWHAYGMIKHHIVF